MRASPAELATAVAGPSPYLVLPLPVMTAGTLRPPAVPFDVTQLGTVLKGIQNLISGQTSMQRPEKGDVAHMCFKKLPTRLQKKVSEGVQ